VRLTLPHSRSTQLSYSCGLGALPAPQHARSCVDLRAESWLLGGCYSSRRCAGEARKNGTADRRRWRSSVSLPPLVEPAAELTVDEIRRYSRHLIIPDVAVSGQKRLKNAKVLCVGAGGLGSPALMYLAAAG